MRQKSVLTVLLIAAAIATTVCSCSNPSAPSSDPGGTIDPVTPPVVPPGSLASFLVRNTTSGALDVNLGPYAATGTPTASFTASIAAGADHTFAIDAGKDYCAWYGSGYAATYINKSSARAKFNLAKDASRVLLIYTANVMGYSITTYDYGQVIGGVDTCLPPAISPNGGAFDVKQNVSIASEGLAAYYYYSIDGADPVPAAAGTTQYLTPIGIEGNHVLRAIATQQNGKFAASPVATASFTIPDKTGPSYVRNIAVTDNTTGHAVTLTWTNPPDYDYDHVDISYTGGASPSSYAKGLNSAVISGLADGKSYTFSFTPYDATGNAGTIATYYVTTPDKTAPTLTITTSESGYTNLLYYGFSLAISESVVAFDQSMIVPTGASLTSFYYDSANRRVTFWLSSSNAVGTLATVSWKIPAGSFKDAAGNSNAEVAWSIQCYNANLQNIWGSCAGADPSLVYAIDYGSSSLLEFDTGKRIVTNMYSLAAAPISMKKQGSIIYIALSGASSLLRFDLSTKSFLSGFSMPGNRTIHDFMIDGPRSRILILDYDSALTLSDRSSYAQFIDLSTGALLSATTPKVVNGTAGVIDPNGGFGVFVAAGMSPMTFERYTIAGNDIGTGHSSLRTDDSYYGPLAISPDGSTLCCHYYNSEVKFYKTDSTLALSLTSSGKSCIAGAIYDSSGAKLYMTPYSINSTTPNSLLTVNASDLSTLSSTTMNTSGCDVVYPCLTSDAKYLVAFAKKSSNSFFVCQDLSK
jgi:hypothetical protein